MFMSAKLDRYRRRIDLEAKLVFLISAHGRTDRAAIDRCIILLTELAVPITTPSVSGH